LGGDHIQPLVSRENFDLANEMLTTKTIKKDDQEPDYFPMAVCGVCGKKLTFKRSRSIYDSGVKSPPFKAVVKNQTRLYINVFKPKFNPMQLNFRTISASSR